jgi:hypothetical protein
VVISHADGALSSADAANLAALRDALGEQLVGELSPLADGEATPVDAIDLAALLAGQPRP